MVARPQVLFWRTTEGAEVDFVIETAGRLLPIEVKSTRSPGPRDVKHLRTFRDEYRDLCPGGLLLHDDHEVAWLAEGILAAPWWRVI